MDERSGTGPAKGTVMGLLRVARVLASLRLTVVLLAMAMVLVFAGTLAQIDEGIQAILQKYFRSWIVLIPLQVFFPRSWSIPGAFPFPGGWLLGGVLLANLLAAHAVRFKATRRRIGILLTHAGLVLLLVGEAVTGIFAVEGNLSIEVGGASNYLEHTHAAELAIVEPLPDGTDEVTVVPAALVRRGGLIRNELLPFEIEVERYMPNAALVAADDRRRATGNPATAGTGLRVVAVQQPPVSGADPRQPIDLPAAYVTLREPGSQRSIGTYLVSLELDPQPVILADRTVRIALRPKRSYKPYTVELKEFRHDKYVGTEVPKNFSSRVLLTDPARNVSREVLISMNNPLRYGGETFYQASFMAGDRGTVLQVVRNPGWLLPYVSCVMVAAGLIVHFLMHLIGFVRRRAVS
jgi:hypothetical protein